MKKILLPFVCVLTAVLLSACESSSPEACVKQCWKLLDKGRYNKAVELFDIPADHVPVYTEMFAENGGALRSAGGVKSVEIVSKNEGADDATVEAAVHLGNGNVTKCTYHLIKRNGAWKILNE